MRRGITSAAIVAAAAAILATAPLSSASAGSASSGGCQDVYCPGQLLGNPGFETGTPAPWSASPGVVNSYPAEPARTGSWKAWLDGYGTAHTDTLSQTVTLSAGYTNYTLSFWLHIDTWEQSASTAFDRLVVKAGSTTLATYSNRDHNTGYALKSFSLGGFAGQTVTISFTGTEDMSSQTSFVIDDAAVSVTLL